MGEGETPSWAKQGPKREEKGKTGDQPPNQNVSRTKQLETPGGEAEKEQEGARGKGPLCAVPPIADSSACAGPGATAHPTHPAPALGPYHPERGQQMKTAQITVSWGSPGLLVLPPRWTEPGTGEPRAGQRLPSTSLHGPCRKSGFRPRTPATEARTALPTAL